MTWLATPDESGRLLSKPWMTPLRRSSHRAALSNAEICLHSLSGGATINARFDRTSRERLVGIIRSHPHSAFASIGRTTNTPTTSHRVMVPSLTFRSGHIPPLPRAVERHLEEIEHVSADQTLRVVAPLEDQDLVIPEDDIEDREVHPDHVELAAWSSAEQL